ncbi:MAG: DUF1080 domain-containing protein [Bacteroidales bacterium]|nr:DUF1080 domain-containing protein [Bacteroidales bacterium]
MKNFLLVSSVSRNSVCRLISATFLLFVAVNAFNSASAQPKPPITGRWDLTLNMNGKPAPSWLEVKLSGVSTLVGYFVGDAGSERPISQVDYEGGKVTFSIPKQWESGNNDMLFEATLANEELSGTITSCSGEKYPFTGVRAPLLKRSGDPTWGTPITLFNGRNLDGWVATGPDNKWVAANGILKSPGSGANLMTTAKFNDFKLHIEFRLQPGSNSGVYLRGRYEVQVIDCKGEEPSSTLLGGVYGFLTPNENVAKAPGEWQTYDITLIGRRVTIEANGKKIINDQIIPGITGGAIDSKEGEPGPILLQGDHGSIEFRNIVLTPAK